MSEQIQSFLATIGAIGILIALVLITTYRQTAQIPPEEARSEQAAGATTTPANIATPTAPILPHSTTTAPKTTKEASVISSKKATSTPTPAQSEPSEKQTESQTQQNTDSQNGRTVRRIENPYPFAPQSFDAINAETRLALVNIYCGVRTGTLRPTSGSGIIIDREGIILTNAHVAQYVLLASDPRVDLSCIIRSGSPARSLWNVEVLYIPPIWVKEHASEITAPRAMSTGEHDYALLRITGTIDGSKMPESFPFISPDIREAIGFIDDPVLVASYPAEFIGGITSQFNLFPVTSITNIKDMLTFFVKSVDVISLGGVIEAQSGSSGGAVVNAWQRLVGLISTTSEGTTTAERDLRAITLSYINRDLYEQTGADLFAILGGNAEEQALLFNTNEAPLLLKRLIDQIKGN